MSMCQLKVRIEKSARSGANSVEMQLVNETGLIIAYPINENMAEKIAHCINNQPQVVKTTFGGKKEKSAK